MKEKSFQTQFGHWLKANYSHSGAFELKSARGKSLPFSDVQPHQEQALWHVKHKSIYHKIPDVGYQNPFDCLVLSKADAYVVVRFGSGKWYMIDIDAWIEERNSSKRKSITEERAQEIGLHIL